MSHNRIAILRDGKIPKFVESVFKVVFSGQQAIKYGQEILYVTERAVFRLTERGIILEEVAPGIDVDKDITSKMGFIPRLGSIKPILEYLMTVKWALEMRLSKITNS